MADDLRLPTFYTNMFGGMLTYTAGVGWVNFFFLGAGGSGMPYFSLLSAALSLYFIWSAGRKENQLNH